MVEILKKTNLQKSRHSGLGLLVVSTVALVGAGCSQSTNQGGILPSQQSIAQPQSLQPAPLTPVKEAKLEPVKKAVVPKVEPKPTPIPEEPKVVVKEAPKKVALNDTTAQPVTHKALIGAWTVSNAGANCQLFLALTKWSGGYRAAPRGCASTGIAKVAAWDVRGKQVVLVDTSGSQVATLYRAGDVRYSGSTSAGSAIILSR